MVYVSRLQGIGFRKGDQIFLSTVDTWIGEGKQTPKNHLPIAAAYNADDIH